jgi:hypothetical protein
MHAANFSLATDDRGQGPIQAMTREQVVVTLSRGTGCCPALPVLASPVIGASDLRHGGRVPVGRAFAVKVVRTHGSILSIKRWLASDRRRRRCCGRPTSCWPG